MKLHKFSDVDAFVALDLPDAEAASGPVRWARKILQGGAKDLARSQTYTYAALQMRRSGASAGINAEAPRRAEALAEAWAEHCDKALSALAGNNDGAGKPTRCGASVPTWCSPDPRWGSSTTEWPRHSNAGP